MGGELLSGPVIAQTVTGLAAFEPYLIHCTLVRPVGSADCFGGKNALIGLVLGDLQCTFDRGDGFVTGVLGVELYVAWFARFCAVQHADGPSLGQLFLPSFKRLVGLDGLLRSESQGHLQACHGLCWGRH